MPDIVVLPELARSLRALGAARDPASEAAHAALFTPLLDARARAATEDVQGALAALRGEPLAVRILARVTDAAHAGEPDQARARARAARARELIEPLRAELTALDVLGASAHGAAPTDPEWLAWVAQLRRVFATADDACRALARLLAEPAGGAPAHYWFGRLGR
jgi:hypothetical protein